MELPGRNNLKLVFVVILGFLVSHLTWRLFFVKPEDSLQWRFKEAHILLRDGVLNYWYSQNQPWRSEYRSGGIRLGFDSHSGHLLWRAVRVAAGDLRNDERQAKWLEHACVRYAMEINPYASARDAEQLAKRALSIRLRRFGELHPKTAGTLLKVAMVHDFQGTFAESARDYGRAIRIYQTIYGINDPRRVLATKARASLAYLYEKYGQKANAEKIYRDLWQTQRFSPSGWLDTPYFPSNLPAFLCRTNRPREAATLYEDLLRVQRTLENDDYIATVGALVDTYCQFDRFDLAESLARERLEWSSKKFERHDPSLMYWRDRHAELLYKLHRTEEAEQQYKRGLELREQNFGRRSLQAAYGTELLAGFYNKSNQLGKSAQFYLAALEIRKELLRSHVMPGGVTNKVSRALYRNEHFYRTSDYLFAMWHLSDVFRALGNFKGAELLDREALRLSKAEAGRPGCAERLTLVARAMNSLGLSLKLQGRYYEAEPLLVESLRIRRKWLGNDKVETLSTMTNLAALYVATNRNSEAEPLSAEAVRTGFKAFGNSAFVLTCKSNHACVLSGRGQSVEALKLDEEVLAARRRLLGHEDPDTATSMNNLASVYGHQGRYLKAKALYEESLTVRKKILGVDHPHTKAVIRILKYLNEAMKAEKINGGKRVWLPIHQF